MSARHRNAWARPVLPGVLAVGLAGAVVALGAGPAAAVGGLEVSPAVVAPGGKIVVEGTCPEPVAGAYERATVGVDAIGRYVVVDVKAGGDFRATFRAHGVGEVAEPEPGDNLRAQVSCATAQSYVATVGTVSVDVVTQQEADAARASASAVASAAPAAATSKRPASSASGSAGGEQPVPPWIPIAALAVAVAGTIGAFTVSRRGDQRAAAMTGHPAAQRGVGRDDRREAR